MIDMDNGAGLAQCMPAHSPLPPELHLQGADPLALQPFQTDSRRGILKDENT